MHSSQYRSCRTVAGCSADKAGKSCYFLECLEQPLVSFNISYHWLHFHNPIPLLVIDGLRRISLRWFSIALSILLVGGWADLPWLANMAIYSTQFTPCECSALVIKGTDHWTTNPHLNFPCWIPRCFLNSTVEDIPAHNVDSVFRHPQWGVKNVRLSP
jgi:hypothetical protein